MQAPTSIMRSRISWMRSSLMRTNRMSQRSSRAAVATLIPTVKLGSRMARKARLTQQRSMSYSWRSMTTYLTSHCPRLLERAPISCRPRRIMRSMPSRSWPPTIAIPTLSTSKSNTSQRTSKITFCENLRLWTMSQAQSSLETKK